MKASSWKWMAVGALAVVCVGILIWAMRSPIQEPSPGTKEASTRDQSGTASRASSQGETTAAAAPEIVRAPHSVRSPAPKDPAPTALPATPGEARPAPEQVRKSPAKLNRGVGRLGNVAVGGEMAAAIVSTPDKNSYQLRPNQLGRFERIYVTERDIVSATVTYPRGQEQQPVQLLVLDGGKLDNGKMTKLDSLDSTGRVTFDFQVTEQLGVHRVKLTKGTDQKILEFWVGQPPPRAEPLAAN